MPSPAHSSDIYLLADHATPASSSLVHFWLLFFSHSARAYNMKSYTIFSVAIAACIGSAATETVAANGVAEGFAKGVTGGGSATPVYPDIVAELISYLADDEARVIVLTKTLVRMLYS